MEAAAVATAVVSFSSAAAATVALYLQLQKDNELQTQLLLAEKHCKAHGYDNCEEVRPAKLTDDDHSSLSDLGWQPVLRTAAVTAASLASDWQCWQQCSLQQAAAPGASRALHYAEHDAA